MEVYALNPVACEHANVSEASRAIVVNIVSVLSVYSSMGCLKTNLFKIAFPP